MATVLDHVLDTVQHLLKKKVALERAIDPDTPDIIADGSRIVQVCTAAIMHSCWSAWKPSICLAFWHSLGAVACLMEGELASFQVTTSTISAEGMSELGQQSNKALARLVLCVCYHACFSPSSASNPFTR